jgi:hypothetical protein
MNETKELEQELQKVDAPVLKYFNTGLSEQEVNNLFRQIDLRPSEELIYMYTWRNGLRYEGVPSGKLSFGLNGVFFPLQDSIEMYQKFIVEQFPSFFPIFWDDTFLINLNAESEDYQKVFIYSPPLLIIEPQSCYDSLKAMIRTFVTCFRQGIFSYDNERLFQEQRELAVEVSKSINPRSEYWT